MENPIVFISYSWDDEKHKEWVLTLANQLRKDGVDVILDRYYLRPGKNVPFFIENSLRRSNRVIIVLTPNYKRKAENRQGGVGQEFSMINNELAKNITDNERIIPILRTGKPEESVPEFLQQFIYLSFTNLNNFAKNYEELLREIYTDPKIKIPELGNRPDFNLVNTEKEVKTGEDLKNENQSNNETDFEKIIAIADSISSRDYQETNEKASSIYEFAPNVPLKDILHLTKEKAIDLNIAAAISLKSYIENLNIDFGANPDVRSFIFYGINHKNSFLRYRIFDLISISDSLKEDFNEEIKEQAKVEKNKEVLSKINTFLKIKNTVESRKLSQKKKIIERITTADLETALELTRKYAIDFGPGAIIDIISLQAQYSKFKQDKLRNIISLEDSDLRYNKMVNSLISLLDEI